MIEVQFLNYLIQSGDYSIVESNSIDASYFPMYKDEFNYIKENVDEFNTVPSQYSFLSRFPKFNIINVTDTPEMLVRDLSFDRLVRIVATDYNDIREFHIKGDRKEFINKIRGSIDNFSNALIQGQAIKDFSGEELIDMVVSSFQEDFNKRTYSTGIKEFDDYFGGWNADSDYVIIAGRPGHGKSMLMCKFAAEQLKQGKRVGYYSGEMPTKQVTERIISAIYNLSSSKIFYKDISIKEELMKALGLFKSISNNLFIAEQSSFGNKKPTALQLEAFCKQNHIEVLFVDQQSLMADMEYSRQFFEKAANISSQLFELQKRLQIPVITANQLNRTKMDDNMGDTVQLAGSDKIGQDATKVIILHKEVKDNSDITLCNVSISKNRNLKTGNFNLRVNLDRNQWVSENENISTQSRVDDVGEDIF